MAPKVTGNQIDGLVRQSGSTIKQLDDGTWEAEIRYYCRWAKAMKFAPIRNVARHPDFPALVCNGCAITQLKPGLVAELRATYRGFAVTSPDGTFTISDRSTEEIISSTSSAEIVAHPKFNSDIGGTKASPKNGAIFDDKGKFLGFAADSKYAGGEVFNYASTIYRVTTPTNSRPGGLGGVGKIASPPISGPAGTNWLLMARTWQRDGAVYSVSEEYMLSAPGGWDSIVYG